MILKTVDKQSSNGKKRNSRKILADGTPHVLYTSRESILRAYGIYFPVSIITNNNNINNNYNNIFYRFYYRRGQSYGVPFRYDCRARCVSVARLNALRTYRGNNATNTSAARVTTRHICRATSVFIYFFPRFTTIS